MGPASPPPETRCIIARVLGPFLAFLYNLKDQVLSRSCVRLGADFDVPLYEYECLPEHHRFEVRHGMNEDPIGACQVCGGEVRRVIHPVGIVFKGSGFYVTDSRKASSTVKTGKAGGSDDKPAETRSDSGSETKSDTGSETKSDTKKDSPSEPKTPTSPAS
jgi:putative FmdB family regulatory protein